MRRSPMRSTIIQRDTAWLELGQYIFEFIALAIPIKKLHPRFQEERKMMGHWEDRLFF